MTQTVDMTQFGIKADQPGGEGFAVGNRAMIEGKKYIIKKVYWHAASNQYAVSITDYDTMSQRGSVALATFEAQIKDGKIVISTDR